ncbi:phospholipase D [Ranunculus cassubicifolius]
MCIPYSTNAYISFLFIVLIIITVFSQFLALSAITSKLDQTSDDNHSECKAWLVQSIPTDMPDLFSAQPDNPNSGDYGYSQEQLDQLGANLGLQVYQSVENAADRNVAIRILQHAGKSPDYTEESANLASGRPNVENVTLLLDEWWGSGATIHSNIWISDEKDMYIGSAKNDWKSYTQVKEVGIYLLGCSRIAKKLEQYYDNLWILASLNSSDYSKTVWDQQWQVYRKVPCWSHFFHPSERCRSPLPSYVEVNHVTGYPTLVDPYIFDMPIETPGYNTSSQEIHTSYLSFAPPELLIRLFSSNHLSYGFICCRYVIQLPFFNSLEHILSHDCSSKWVGLCAKEKFKEKNQDHKESIRKEKNYLNTSPPFSNIISLSIRFICPSKQNSSLVLLIEKCFGCIKVSVIKPQSRRIIR